MSYVQRVTACLSACLILAALSSPVGAEARSDARLLPLQAVKAVAAREGLLITSVYAEAPRRLVVLCEGPLGRALFLRRASLVAFAAFQSWAAPVEVVFEHSHQGVLQRCRVRKPDLDAYVNDRIGRAEYDRRLAYQVERLGVSVPPPPPFPATALSPIPSLTTSPSPVASAPPVAVSSASVAPSTSPSPAVSPSPLTESESAVVARTPVPSPNFFITPPPASTEIAAVPRPGAELPPEPPSEWRAGYALGLGTGVYDALSLEYARPILPSLDLRPSFWMIGGLAPRSLFSRSASTIDGVSLAFDLLGTGHRLAGASDVSFEGGVGLRAAVLQGATTGVWPATHLRVGTRWRSWNLSLRYPLLARPGDPTAIWDVSVGYHWSPSRRQP